MSGAGGAAGGPQPVVVLTIAGSDSGAGAGLQADLKTFAAIGVFGTSAVTAVTAQNTAEVRDVLAVPPALVDAQIGAVVDDFAVVAAKTGMLAQAETVSVVARRAAAGDLPNLVVDPVLVASTGRPLLDDDAVARYLDELLPCAAVATPNLREAGVLTGATVTDADGMVRAAQALCALGAGCVVVKGGHLAGGAAPDVVVAGGEVTWLAGDRIATANDHGTGCSLAAAIAGFLGLGAAPLEAVRGAKSFVAGALAGAAGWHLGSGHGPLDHFGWGLGAAPPAGARAELEGRPLRPARTQAGPSGPEVGPEPGP